MNIGLVILIIFAILAAVMFIIVLVQNSANKRKAEYNMNKYKLSQKENKAMKQCYRETTRALESENEVLRLKVELMEAQKENKRLGNKLDKCLLEAKDSKIEAQNAKIMMLQADCSRLQRELIQAKNPKISVITDYSVDNKK